MKRLIVSFLILNNRIVPEKPEWFGSGKKFSQCHLCHFRGTLMFLLFNQVKSTLADPYLMYLRNYRKKFGDQLHRGSNLQPMPCQVMTLPLYQPDTCAYS